jgi:membrane fusion protein (multidrug efflux system)
MRRLQNNYERSKELFDRKLVSTESNDQLRFELESAKAAFELAKLELSYTTITAPISGVIAQRFAKPGNLINVNSPVYRIIDNSRLEAVLNVPERELATMKAGLPIQMVVDALPGQQFTGVVDRISPVVDAGSGTFRVVGAFDGKLGLRPGMFGRINVVHDQRAAVLTVPRAALIEENGAYAVYVVRDNKAVRMPVKLGYINGEFAEVLEGVKEGDPLVTAGKIAVRDGSAIQVIKNEPEAAPAEAVAEAK